MPSSPFASFEEVIRFHGHVCPGLAIGYQISLAAMNALGVTRPDDEELVAIAETDACGVDAIQVVCGCTSGKGNLIIKDYGKNVFTFINRANREAVRVIGIQPNIPEQAELSCIRAKIFSGNASEEEQRTYHNLTHAVVKKILALNPDEVTTIDRVTGELPATAKIFTSIPCECCGEMVADGKTKEYSGKRICIPCYLKKTT